MISPRKRFQIEPLEDRFSPALLTIDPTAVGGAVQGPQPCLHPIPGQATTGLDTAEAVSPSNLVSLVKGQ